MPLGCTICMEMCGSGVQIIGMKNYEGAPRDGSAWVTGGDSDLRLLRGGSWGNDPWSLPFLPIVYWSDPVIRHNRYGFFVFVCSACVNSFSLFSLALLRFYPIFFFLSREARSNFFSKLGQCKIYPLFKKTYDLIKWYVPILNRLPRDQKFLLGDRNHHWAV